MLTLFLKDRFFKFLLIFALFAGPVAAKEEGRFLSQHLDLVASSSSAPGTSPATDPAAQPLTATPSRPTGAEPGTAAPRPTGKKSREVTPELKRALPVYLRTATGCLDKQKRVHLIGSNLGDVPPRVRAVTLKGAGQSASLEIKRWSGKEIIVAFPKSLDLQPGQRYQIILKINGLIVAGEGNRRSYRMCDPTDANLPVKIQPQKADHIAAELLVLLSKDLFGQARVDAIKQELDRAGYLLLKESNLAGLNFVLLRVKMPSAVDEDEGLRALRVQYPDAVIDFNHISELSGQPRLYADTLTARTVQAKKCQTVDGEGFSIGVLDGGADLNHPAIRGDRNIKMAAFGLDGGGLPKASDHGTAIAVQYKGRLPKEGYDGLMVQSSLFIADILSRKSGRIYAATSSFLEGMNWLIGRKVDFINMSLEGPENRAVGTVLAEVSNKNIGLFAAAGNGGAEARPPYPAAHSDVVGVTAVDREKQVYRLATRGSHVDFAAPGVMLWLAKAGGKGSYRSGTSFAVPYVVARAALEMTKAGAKQQNSRSMILPKLSASALDLGQNGPDPVFGFGLIQFEGC
ncbi:S8 family serine peptidase [Sneathiella sp.]|jgi:hypothetical protein|uniref:S8 family serine peptidase n=1 Tax=Sneathiella sp. TaxID=1964365 RepID=UPI0039E3F2A7